MPAPLRVVLLGDDPLARSALESLLARDGDVSLIGQGGASEAAALVESLDPDVIVWDAGIARGADAEHEGPSLGGGAPLLALVAGESQTALARLAGARAILRRDSDGPRLLAALHAVAQGLSVFDDAAVAALLRPAPERALGEPIEPLTPREQEVLQLLGSGQSNKQIARRLAISEHTAKFHVARVLQKLGAASRSEAVFLGARLGLLLL